MNKKTVKPKEVSNPVFELAMKNGDIETIKKLLFYQKFHQFQSELPVIPKTVTVITAEGEYKYAPLDEIIAKISPLLKQHKLTYRWDFVETNGDIVCTCVITDAETGYEVTSTMKSPKDNTMMNELHGIGSARTYLQRYTLVAVLGIATVDDDNDGRTAVIPKVEPEVKPKEEVPAPKKKLKITVAEEIKDDLFGGRNDN